MDHDLFTMMLKEYNTTSKVNKEGQQGTPRH
jgi:hypothetical protein